MTGETFSDRVQAYLRASGYSQKDLADELGLHSKVLSRKLHGSSNAHMTQLEVGRIIKTFARWRAITTRSEAIQLLELAQLKQTSLTSEEWQSSPLNLLEDDSAQSPLPQPSSSVPLSSTDHEMHNLPAPVTRLIGRQWAVERLRQLLGRNDIRLITLFGPGGSGKTRLALHVATEMLTAFPHGVWFVTLTGISDPAMVPMSIIQALGLMPSPHLQPVPSLLHFLRDKKLLLILDNFEQVVETAPLVSEILAAAPKLKVLVTSRVVLHLYGEHAFSVPPLDVPDPDVVLDPAELAQFAAVQLFVERAQAATHDFTLTAENARCITQICARLDGLPLALELAAAQIKLLPPAQLLDRLSESRLSTLRKGARNLPQRQQTLRNTIEWSYYLLSPEEQQWFLRLGVFTGGWQFEAAEAMIQTLATLNQEDPSSALDVLEQLVDKSLIVSQPAASGLIRFAMLETLREYSLEQLAARKELDQLRDWHASYYLAIAEVAEAGLRGKNQLAWLKRLSMEQDNLRAALEWGLYRARAARTSHISVYEVTRENIAEHRTTFLDDTGKNGLTAAELCLRLAAALQSYWEWQGYIPEGRHWLEAALTLPLEDTKGHEKTLLAARAKALSCESWFLHLQNDRTRAGEQADASIALWQQVADQDGLLAATIRRGWIAHAQGNLELAGKLFDQCLQHLSPTSNPWLCADLFYNMGEMAGFAFDFAKAQSLLAQSGDLFDQLGDARSKADVLNARGGFMIMEGNYTQALSFLTQGMALGYEAGNKKYVAEAIGIIGFALGLRQEPDTEKACLQAAHLIGAGEGLLDQIGVTTWLKTQPFVQATLQWMRDQIGEQNWQHAWDTGRTLTLEQAMEQAYRLAT